MASIPNTHLKTRTNHSLAVRVRGITIGLLQTWNYALKRQVTPVYELNPDTTGEPVDNVPGNISDLDISVQRVDLYSSKMEEAFGGINLNMLSDQNNPFEVVEVWKNPDGTVEQYVYEGCWFTSISRDNAVSSDRIVKATGSLKYIRRIRIQ